MTKKIFILFSLLLISACSTINRDLPPFADIHLHFNWDHEELLSAEEAIKILDEHGVTLAVVSSVPSDFALKLKKAGGDWVVPFITPYYDAGNRLNWYFDKTLVGKIRTMIETGNYKGIGEVHLSAGVGPRRDNPVFTGLLDLAREFKLPFLIHTDTSDYRYFLPICKKYSDVRFLWAHAGSVLQPDHLDPLMEACPNVWLDLAARDKWHYGDFAYENHTLLPGWRELIIKYQDRVMTGTDPVWNAHQIYRWYEADHGWFHYSKMHYFHRKWMAKFPPKVEEKLRLKNAQKFFGIKGR